MTVNNYDTIHYIHPDTEKYPKPVCSANGFYYETSENINEVTCGTCKKVYERMQREKEKNKLKYINLDICS